MKRSSIVIFIVVFFAILGGFLYWLSLKPGTALPGILSRLQPSQNQKYTSITSSIVPSGNETRNPKLYVKKNISSPTQTMYVVRGTVLTAPKNGEGLYSFDLAVEGDPTKTAVKVQMGSGDSQLSFGSLDKNQQIVWGNKKTSDIAPQLVVGKNVELRIVINRGDDAMVKAFEPNAEALLKATEITPTTFSIQPLMIAIL